MLQQVDMPNEFTTNDHLERHERELDVLASVSAILAAQSGQQEMLTRVLHELEQKLKMRQSTVMLLSADGSELFVEATRSRRPRDWHALRYRRGEGVTGNEIGRASWRDRV